MALRCSVCQNPMGTCICVRPYPQKRITRSTIILAKVFKKHCNISPAPTLFGPLEDPEIDEPEPETCTKRHCAHCGECLEENNGSDFCSKDCNLWYSGIDTLEEHRGER